MSRWFAALLLLAVAPLFAQEGPKLKKRGEPTAVPQNVDKDGLPPEEDTSIAVPVYGFNPLQAQKKSAPGTTTSRRAATARRPAGSRKPPSGTATNRRPGCVSARPRRS
jgi:hypothetical protein